VPSSNSNPYHPETDPSPLADPSRWAALIEDVRPEAFLVVIASSMSRRLHEACTPEDIWQETLSQAWSAREQHQWQGRAAFRAWLFEIARNRICDEARRIQTQKRGSGRPAERIADPAGDTSSASEWLPPDSVTPSREAIRAERTLAIQAALEGLPPELEPVVRMHLLEEMTMESIAEKLGIGVSAAWHRFRKGAELYSKALAAWTGGTSG
jgi:RNA polymerase sigma factor (sigma-70 family)